MGGEFSAAKMNRVSGCGSDVLCNPNTSFAIARTRSSTSPNGGRHHPGILPPLRSAMSCIVHPISATTPSFESVVMYGCVQVWTARCWAVGSAISWRRREELAMISVLRVCVRRREQNKRQGGYQHAGGRERGERGARVGTNVVR